MTNKFIYKKIKNWQEYSYSWSWTSGAAETVSYDNSTSWLHSTSVQWAIDEIVSNEVFSNSWDGDTNHAPSKNAVYDAIWDIETLLSNL